MRFNFASILAVCALLSGECIGAVANDELAKYTDKKSYIEGVQKEVRNAISQSKHVDQKAVKENIEKQIEAIKIFRAAQQKHTDAIETLQKVRETQSKIISTIKSAISNGKKSQAENALKALQNAQNKQTDAIKTLQTARDKKQNAVKTLVSAQRRQFIWFILSESAKRAAMFIAIKKGYTDVIDSLLESGVDPNATDNKGITLTMIAAQYDENILPKLIKNGANIKAKDKDGYNVLDYAYIGKIKKNIQLLLKKGVKANRIKTKSY